MSAGLFSIQTHKHFCKGPDFQRPRVGLMLGNAKICTFETTGPNFHWIHPDVFDESGLFKASARVWNSAIVNPIYNKILPRHCPQTLLVATSKTLKQLGNGLVRLHHTWSRKGGVYDVTLLLGFHLGCYIPETSELLFTHFVIVFEYIHFIACMFLKNFHPIGR